MYARPAPTSARRSITPCAPLVFSPLRPVRPLPHCAGVPKAADDKLLSTSALPPRLLPSPVPARQACTRSLDTAALPSHPPRHRLRLRLPATEPPPPRPPASAAPRSPAPCILALLPTCPALGPAYIWTPQTERTQGGAVLCLCGHVAGLHLGSPDSSFHSHCPALATRVGSRATGTLGAYWLLPGLAGSYSAGAKLPASCTEPPEAAARPRLLPCLRPAALTVASCPA